MDEEKYFLPDETRVIRIEKEEKVQRHEECSNHSIKKNMEWRPCRKYAAPDLGPCEYHYEGEIFYSNGWQKPEGLCDNAWKCMQEYVIALAHGAEDFYDGELLVKRLL